MPAGFRLVPISIPAVSGQAAVVCLVSAGAFVLLSLTSRPSDICQDGNQVLFKACPGTKDVPCERTVHMGQSEDPRCPLHLILPPPMFQPEQEASLPEALGAASRDMYLSAAELQPTENLPLEFSDVRYPVPLHTQTQSPSSTREVIRCVKSTCRSQPP